MLKLLLWLGLAAVVPLHAQWDGALTGDVKDPTDAPIAGARVTVQNTATSIKKDAVTDATGVYNVLGLAPGDYLVIAEFDGFQKKQSRLRVDGGSKLRIDFLLNPKGTQETIEVTADPPAIETESGALINTISEQELQHLPLAGRNALEMAVLVPGVTGDHGSDEAGIFQDVPTAGAGLSIAGGRAGSSAILADGAGANSVGIGRATVTFTPDTISEVQVITSTFSAKYGQSGGGVVNTVSKAGSNTYRGSTFWYHRNPVFHARQFNRPFPNSQRRNELGLTLGGPVVIPKLYNGKRRTFFFGSFEPKYYFDQIDIYTRFPTAEERRGDFRNSWVAPGARRPLLYQQVRCSPNPQDCRQLLPQHRPSSTAEYPLWNANNPDPSKRGLVIPEEYIDPLVKKILDDVPLPNMTPDPQGRNYFGTRGVDGTDGRWNLKIDHNFSQKNRISGRLSTVPLFSDRYRVEKGNLFMSYPSDISNTRQAVITDSHTFSPRIVNELRAVYTFGNYSRTAPGDMANTNYVKEKFGLPNSTDWGYPLFQSGFGNYGFDHGVGLGQYLEHQYQLTDDLSIIRGKHTLSIGFDIRELQFNMRSSGLREACCGIYAWAAAQTNSGNANTLGGTGGLQFASFLLGVPNAVTLRSIIVPYYYRWRVGAAYFQDDWKVTRNLTFNMGVRWQYNSPRAEKWNRQATIDLDNPIEIEDAQGNFRSVTFNYLYSGFQGRSRYLEPAYKRNIEPRFGFAYAPKWGPFKSRTLVFRGGYGISHPATTGRGREPIPDFGAGASGSFGYARFQSGSNPARTQSENPGYLIRIGANRPVLISEPGVLDIPAGGTLCISCTSRRDSRLPAGATVLFAKDSEAPYVQTWNFTVQSELPFQSVLTLSYLGTKGTHLYSPLLGVNHPDRDLYEELLDEGADPNELVEDPFGRVDAAGNPLLIPRVNLLRPFPTAGDINVAGLTNANSIYHALTASVDRRFSKGVYFRVNYTWGKSIDTSSDGLQGGSTLYLWGNTRVQDAHDLKANRSVSNYDTRHRLNIAGTWQLPMGKGKLLFSQPNRYAAYLLNNWSVNAIGTIMTGTPFSVHLGDANGLPGGATGAERIRPDIVLGVPLINPRWSKNVANDVPYINPEAFARPAHGHTGNAPRTLDWVRNPRRETLNASLFREFYPFETRRRYFQFRAEFVNVLNHTYFQTTANETFHLFASGVPSSRTGLPLQGPIPYLWNLGSGSFPVGTRNQVLAQYYNQNFGKLWRDRNGPGRTTTFALKFFF
ncbi:MAG: carboxypeptidase regulatory-like domain-containing protein [Bryobacterales bacterium]|nr:carboxypeptidase regulatory-like domain-containing protein [Bryobacterales bacterium]